MKGILNVVGAALLGATFLAHAQAPAAPGADAKKSPTPEQRQKLRETLKSAHEACKDKGGDRHACMQEQVCAKASDPAKCQAEAKERAIKRAEAQQKAAEACTGKAGEELVKCRHEQRRQHHKDHKKSS